jgi:type II secretory pathway component GspD/PulD (secretin)
MFAINNRLTATLILTLMLASTAIAQQAQPAPTAAPRDDFVQEKGFKTKIIEVKYRDPMSLYRVITTLSSGVKGAAINPNSEFKTLTVRDYPENIATIEEAVKRLDTPEATPPDIELHVHILIASNAANASNEHPAELNDVIKQLQGTLAYKSYSLMASTIQHVKASGRGSSNSGVAETKLFNVDVPPGNAIFYEYALESISLQAAAGGQNQVQTSNFVFNMRIPLNVGTINPTQPSIQYQNVGFRTPVSVREGEKVVVGTTTMGDKGLIVVLSAKVLNK